MYKDVGSSYLRHVKQRLCSHNKNEVNLNTKAYTIYRQIPLTIQQSVFGCKVISCVKECHSCTFLYNQLDTSRERISDPEDR